MLAELPTAEDDRGAERLRALLDELSALPITERWPFFGRLPAALTHPTAGVRVAAVKVLGGATGVPALRAIVHALRDSEPAVRAVAVAALAASSSSDPARWAHAAFHPLADVRLAALAHPPGRQLPWYAQLLLADPACIDAV